jgi:two-component system response regulator MprA
MNSPTIAMIDDDRAWTDVAAAVLHDQGFEVQVAHDGVEALDLLATAQPVLVILDVHLPRMSGLRVLHEFRRHDLHSPVLMVSSDDQASLEGQAMSDGACAFLHKPIPLDLLLHAVRRFGAYR